MPAPVIPAHVATGELITSSWGNGVVDSLQFAMVQCGQASYPPTATVSNQSILHQNVPSVPYASRMFVIAHGYAGVDSGSGLDGAMIGINTQIAGANRGSVGTIGPASPASRYQHVSMAHSWAVPANDSPQFSIAVGWFGTGGGTTYVQADLVWWMCRQ